MKLFAGFILSLILVGFASAQSRTTVPQELIGKWYSGSASLLQDVNKTTGVSTSAYGSSIGYELRADGTFQFVGLIKSTMYSCTTSLFNHKKGTYKVKGTTITFSLSKDYWRNDYSCAPRSNKEQNKPLKDEVYEYSIKTDEYGKDYLSLVGADGKEVKYPKSKD